MEEFLKGLGLESETITKIVDGMKESKMFISKEENIDIRYKKLKKDFEDSKKTIDELTEQSKGNEQLQNTIKDYENKLKQTNIDYAIKDALKGAKHGELLKSQFDMTKLSFEDGQVKGIEDQLKGLKETYKDFFEPVAPAPAPQPSGFVPVAGKSAEPNKDGFNFNFNGVRAKE